jgi:putative DNA methylase
MAVPYRKKLIEVGLPLVAINAESARETSIRHGHPSTLHLWWALRPLAACRRWTSEAAMRLPYPF